jgi:hypothetical protein
MPKIPSPHGSVLSFALVVSTSAVLQMGCSAGSKVASVEADSGTGGVSASTGGAPGSGSVSAGPDAASGGSTTVTKGCGANGAFACMAPPMLSPLAKTAVGQWTYQQIDGATCRDGSPAGFYTRFSDSSKNLLIYLEQGGACLNGPTCIFNPKSVDESIAGRTMAEVTNPGVQKIRQKPETAGIFDYSNPQNPYEDWNAVWVPYCTGDAYGGSNPNGVIAGQTATNFVGYMNMQKFVGHIVPTFSDAPRVVLTGTSAGSFGAGLNFNQVQDAFGSVPVTLIMDSGVPFSDAYMTPELQKQWRTTWNLAPLMPPDCTDCNRADGGGFLNLVFYSAKKYPGVKLGVISSVEDDVMKFFFAINQTGIYPKGLADLRQQGLAYRSQFSSYFIPGIKHMYSQFGDFYEPLSNDVTLVSWVNDVLAGNMHDVGAPTGAKDGGQ